MVSAVVPGIYIGYHLSSCETADYCSAPRFTIYTLIQGDHTAYCKVWLPVLVSPDNTEITVRPYISSLHFTLQKHHEFALDMAMYVSNLINSIDDTDMNGID
jgi:hypothetical protein